MYDSNCGGGLPRRRRERGRPKDVPSQPYQSPLAGTPRPNPVIPNQLHARPPHRVPRFHRDQRL